MLDFEFHVYNFRKKTDPYRQNFRFRRHYEETQSYSLSAVAWLRCRSETERMQPHVDARHVGFPLHVTADCASYNEVHGTFQNTVNHCAAGCQQKSWKTVL